MTKATRDGILAARHRCRDQYLRWQGQDWERAVAWIEAHERLGALIGISRLRLVV